MKNPITELKIGTRATIRNVWATEQVFCKQYVGKFTETGLDLMASTGLWFCSVCGWDTNGGSGRTPEAAIQDAIARNNDKIKQLTTTNKLLAKALKENAE